MTTPGTPIVNTVVLNTTDLERSKTFWMALLDTEVGREIPGFFCWLRPQRPGGIQVALQLVASIPDGANPVHIDTTVDDLDAAQARILELGGTHLATHEFDAFQWRIMADPDGHHFCIANEGH